MKRTFADNNYFVARFFISKKEKTMSTRSDISILRPDGTVQTQYIHQDGYLAGVGQKLLDNYKTLEDVEKIQKLGDYRADSILPETPNQIDETIKGLELHKDIERGYASLDVMQKSLKEYSEYPRDYGQTARTLNSDIEYHYLYAPDSTGKYQWQTINRDGIKPLTQEVIDDEEKNGIHEHSANWQYAPNNEWNTPLTKEEKEGFDKGIEQLKQNLEAYDARQLKQAEKVFTSNRVSASWYLQRDKAEEEALDNAYSDSYSKDHTEHEKLKEIESKLTPKQVNYFNKLYDISRDNSSNAVASNKTRFSQETEQKIQSKVESTPQQDTKVDQRTSNKKLDRATWKKQYEKTVDDLKKDLLKEVEHYTETPEQVLELLRFTDKFHQYSTRNTMMIHMQRPSAVAVGSFAKFKSMGYHVKKGEKGIKMFVPTEATFFYRNKKDGNKDIQEPTQLKNATKEERAKIKSGEIQTASKTFYKIGTVFDVTQTDMPKEKYPELYPNRHRDFDMKDPSQLKFLEKGLKQVAQNMNMPVITYDHSMTNISDPQNAKGYFDRNTNQIVLNQYNTPTENVTVLAHELGHAQLHNNKKQEKDLPRELKEMQAELTSYLYSSHYGIDTKDETVQYIADWTENGKKFNELAPDVKGKILTHVGSATKTLTKATDRVIEQEQERIDKIAEETFLKNPETSKWYEQRQAMEKESTQREQGQSVGHTELDKLHELESKMTPHEVHKLDSKFAETQSWNSDGVKSLVSKDVEDKIKQNAKKETSKNVEKTKTTTVSVSEDLTNSDKKEDKSKLKEQYKQYLAQQQGMNR